MTAMDLVVPGWQSRGAEFWMDEVSLESTMGGINDRIVTADHRIREVRGMAGIGYVSRRDVIGDVCQDLTTIRLYVRDLPGDVAAMIDTPLFKAFANGPTEAISRIRTQDIQTPNTLGVITTTTYTTSGEDPVVVTETGPKATISFSDFTDSDAGDFFAQIFQSAHLSYVAGHDDHKTLDEYITALFTSGEFGHEGYHPVASFVSSVFDVTVVWAFYKAIAGNDPLTGEDLDDWARGLEAGMGIINLIAILAAIPSGGASLEGAAWLKGAALAALRVLLVNAASTGASMLTFDAATALGLPRWAATLLALGVGFAVSIVGGKLVILDAGGHPVGDPISLDASDPVAIAGGPPSLVATGAAFGTAQAARDAAIATRFQAIQDLARAKAALQAVLPPGADPIPTFTVGNIDATIGELLDKYPELRSLIQALGRAAWAERDSLTGLKGASEALGVQAARDAITSQGGQVLIDGTSWDPSVSPSLAGAGQRSGAGTFDVVGLSSDGKTLLIDEAKGGSSQLSQTGRIVGYDAAGNPVRAAQGTVEYLNDLLAKDPNMRQLFATRPDIAAGLRAGKIKIQYNLVKATGDGAATVQSLAIDPSQIDLGFLGH